MSERNGAAGASRDRAITIVHTSDLHIGSRWAGHGPLATLAAVLTAARETAADVVLLAGDTFDSHRAAAPYADAVAEAIAASPARVVILPGNHDPATDDAVYRLLDRAAVPNLHVIGVHHEDAVMFDDLDLSVWGAPHTSYADMSPLAGVAPRSRRWHIVVAHGHWVRGPEDHHRGWLIRDDEIDALDADYVALGHWDVPQAAGRGLVPAYYSGSPDVARSVNLVHLSDRGIDISRHPIDL